MMSYHTDPHLRRQEEFGQMGNTVKIGGEIYVACKVIGVPPHTSCPFYTDSAASHEKLNKKKLIESGEFGAREDLGMERLGFGFVNGHEEVQRSRKKVKLDTKLCKMAFDWDIEKPDAAKMEEDQRSREEGERMAALRKVEAIQRQKKLKKEEKSKAKTVKPKQKTSASVKKPPSTQHQTHMNDWGRRKEHKVKEKVPEKEPPSTEQKTQEEVRSHGWDLPPGWGLKGGSGGATPGNSSTTPGTSSKVSPM